MTEERAPYNVAWNDTPAIRGDETKALAMQIFSQAVAMKLAGGGITRDAASDLASKAFDSAEDFQREAKRREQPV